MFTLCTFRSGILLPTLLSDFLESLAEASLRWGISTVLAGCILDITWAQLQILQASCEVLRHLADEEILLPYYSQSVTLRATYLLAHMWKDAVYSQTDSGGRARAAKYGVLTLTQSASWPH